MKFRRPISLTCFAVIGFLPLLALPNFALAKKAKKEDGIVQNDGVRVQMIGVSKPMHRIAEAVLLKQLKLADDKSISAPLADDLAFFLQQRYNQAGYPEARVDWKLPGDEGAVIATLTVEEGPQYFIGELHVEGVDAALETELMPYLTRQTSEREGRAVKKLPFVAADIKAGAQLVQRRLQADGFLDATVAEPDFAPSSSDKQKMDAGVKATPGPKYVFGVIEFVGGEDVISPDRRKSLADLTGQPFNEVTLENMRKLLKGDGQARGYFATEVTAEHQLPVGRGGEVPSKLTMVRGNLFTVRNVGVQGEGLSKGALRVANAVFQPATGRRYEPDALDLFTRRALETGIYDRLDVTPVAVSDNELDLQLQGGDAKPKTLGFFGGYETFSGPIVGIEARNVNFQDTGDTLGGKAEYSFRGINANLQWLDPAIFATKNALSLELSAQTFTFRAYQRWSAGFQASLTRRFSRRVTAELYSGYNYNVSQSDELTPEELGPDEYVIGNAGLKLTLDYRDSPLIPHKGWLFKGAMEAGSGDVNYLRYDLAGSWYQPITKKFRLALGARSSAFQSGDDIGEIPIDLRLFNGGATSVRSFPERELGPTSERGNTPLGGTATAVLNAEFSYEVISNLEIAAFWDAGSLSTEDSSIFSGTDWRYAVGMGVRYNLPIGPLRVDYGYNPNRKEGEPFGALHITFGFAF